MRSRQAWPLTALLAAFPTSLPAADWIEYISENFTVYSDAPENRVVGILEDVEELRRIVHTTLALSDAISIEKIRIFIFDRLPEYGRLETGAEKAMTSISELQGSIIALPMETSEEARRAIIWSYTTLLMLRYSAVDFPGWYSAGLRELLSTAEFSRSEIVLGRPPGGTWSPAPVSQVIAENYDERGTFLTSWLLVHHLVVESTGDVNRQRQTADYLRRFDAGEDPESAFLDSFGMSPREFQTELEFDATTARLSVLAIPREVYAGELSLRALQQDEAAFMLGVVALTLNANARAIEYFDSLDDRENDTQFTERIQAKKAIALIHDGHLGDGDFQFNELLSLDSDDADVLADISHFAFDRHSIGLEVADDSRPDYLKLAIEYGERALALDDRNLHALYDLGLAYEASGEWHRASETLIKAYEIESSSSLLGLTLARVLIKSGQIETAFQVLSRVYRASTSDEDRDQILEIQRRMTEPGFDVSTFDVLTRNRR